MAYYLYNKYRIPEISASGVVALMIVPYCTDLEPFEPIEKLHIEQLTPNEYTSPNNRIIYISASTADSTAAINYLYVEESNDELYKYDPTIKEITMYSFNTNNDRESYSGRNVAYYMKRPYRGYEPDY